MYQWLYKDTIESGIMVPLEEVDEYLKGGYVDTPDKYKEVVYKAETEEEKPVKRQYKRKGK